MSNKTIDDDIQSNAFPKESNGKNTPSSNIPSMRVVLKKIRMGLSRDEINSLNSIKVNVPNFLVLGVQKGGTTWLHENLKSHPEILLPAGKKELEFFSYQKELNSDVISEYLGYFNKVNGFILRPASPIAIGEVTPSYFWTIDRNRVWCNPPNSFNDNVAESVLNLLGSDLKLIVCFRNPVDRAISAYLHHIKYERIDFTKCNILDAGKDYGIIDMGFYAQHLSHWLKYFKMKNFKFLIYERDVRCHERKKKTLKDVCSFLNVDFQKLSLDEIRKFHNKGSSYSLSEEGIFLELAEKESSLIITATQINELYQIYKDDTANLQQIIDLELGEWWSCA